VFFIIYPGLVIYSQDFKSEEKEDPGTLSGTQWQISFEWRNKTENEKSLPEGIQDFSNCSAMLCWSVRRQDLIHLTPHSCMRRCHPAMRKRAGHYRDKPQPQQSKMYTRESMPRDGKL
jgi:hypothetical protein